MQLPTLTEDLALAGSILTGAATAATLVTAGLSATSQLFGHTILGGNNANEVALTYDDGPNHRSTPELLDILARHNARATFFMVGQHVRQCPQIVRDVHAAGHLVANHTFTHPWLLFKPAAFIREELRSTTAALEDILGEPIRYFRAPHGARRPAVIEIASELGMATVQWNAMGKDWLPITPGQIVANIDHGLARARRNHRGANILLHDGDGLTMGADRTTTLRATELLLQRFAREGTQIVTIDAWG